MMTSVARSFAKPSVPQAESAATASVFGDDMLASSTDSKISAQN